jgi:hypothetical protein
LAAHNSKYCANHIVRTLGNPVARPLPEDLLTAIEAVLAKYPDGASYAQIEAALDVPGARRTLQYHLRTLVDAGRLRMTGARRGVRYYPLEMRRSYFG